ncbi:MAG TPA: hypothetical protein VN873_07560 [Candidatus Angelobacter sp.]|nr:hypothetical protein [Candidatus Angelobacter sp.]
MRRLLQKRDHGLYTTVVEEILRELYLDAVGTWVWGRMKKDTQDTFALLDSPAPPRGGRLFVEELGKALRARTDRPKISIVGHSAGSIFACHLLAHVDEMRREGGMPLDFQFHRVAFLAPACRCALWAAILALHEARPLWGNFRMYSLSDTLESGYWEAPFLYPRSLLYIISGLLETPEIDVPILGMQRYMNQSDVYSMPEMEVIRTFLAVGDRQVWSKQNGGAGLSSDALKHGEFDDTTGEHVETMRSVIYFLNH